MTNQTDQMPREVALALLTTSQRMTSRFRKTCLRATERVCEPVSRSTALPVSAPKTNLQKLQRRLRKLNAKQLTTWARRALRKGNRLQDMLGESPDEATLKDSVEQADILGQAIQSELTRRSNGGKLKI